MSTKKSLREKAFSATEALDYIYEYIKKRTKSHERKFFVSYETADDTDQGHSARIARMKYEKFLFVKALENGSWWLMSKGMPTGPYYIQAASADIIAVKAEKYPRSSKSFDIILDRRFGRRKGDHFALSAIVAMKDGRLGQSRRSEFPTLASCAVFAPGCTADMKIETRMNDEGVWLNTFLPPGLKTYDEQLVARIARKILSLIGN